MLLRPSSDNKQQTDPGNVIARGYLSDLAISCERRHRVSRVSVMRAILACAVFCWGLAAAQKTPPAYNLGLVLSPIRNDTQSITNEDKRRGHVEHAIEGLFQGVEPGLEQLEGRKFKSKSLPQVARPKMSEYPEEPTASSFLSDPTTDYVPTEQGTINENVDYSLDTVVPDSSGIIPDIDSSESGKGYQTEDIGMAYKASYLYI